MPTQIETQLQSFHEFVTKQLKNGQRDLTPEQALAKWRERNETVKAIQEALDDMEAGDTGEPADEVIAELRRGIQESKNA